MLHNSIHSLQFWGHGLWQERGLVLTNYALACNPSSLFTQFLSVKRMVRINSIHTYVGKHRHLRGIFPVAQIRAATSLAFTVISLLALCASMATHLTCSVQFICTCPSINSSSLLYVRGPLLEQNFLWVPKHKKTSAPGLLLGFHVSCLQTWHFTRAIEIAFWNSILTWWPKHM